jgi:hypothetical protein
MGVDLRVGLGPVDSIAGIWLSAAGFSVFIDNSFSVEGESMDFHRPKQARLGSGEFCHPVQTYFNPLL